MALTAQQTDSLSELINIAFSRAASSLSDLTGRRVEVSAPVVELMPFPELSARMPSLIPGDAVVIQQVFTGHVGGDALLVFNQASAQRLATLMTDAQFGSDVVDASVAEVLTEIGNILLNACLGVFGNLLDVRVSFSVPRLHVDSASAVLNNLRTESASTAVALIASTAFLLQNSTVKGDLIIVLGADSMDRLIASLKRLG